ncbi:tripartite ATP-independent transporter DctM subunit [Kineosphaera limosa]|uniref:Putative transporter n=1 Tax=Kineosphaera limosa NBRC 100340 TaxID=1184609 RepID=K6W5G4_9MICO|nr:TRAP transporter large permease [Kineosphaera limosa]NYE03073.1 tripartite ATP-independent transporter DctM subunit [Kineosphaera limosa]GAB94410.1 putative transporter [Kineosphaera limosa NBRC 100340]
MSVLVATLVLFGAFLLLLFLGVPIAISIAVSALATMLLVLPYDQASFVVMQKMNSGIESFTLLAVPLFILAGNIMNNGGIAGRLIRFAQLLTGRLPGSLAQTNVMGNMLFGALSGSAVAAAAAIGGTMNKAQEEQKYPKGFAAAVNIASAPTGLLIPPTAAFIVYSMIAGGVSISALFMAGVVPGILMGLVVMVVAFVHARRYDLPRSSSPSRGEVARITLDALPSLLLILLVVGGIVVGVFTATEGAGIAVLYCLVLSLLYRGLTWASLQRVLISSVATSGIILFLIAASSAMSWVMAYTGIPQAISEALLSVSGSVIVVFLLMNLILLVIGTFMDITPAILIFTPIFLPIVTDLGMDPVHFGVVLIFNMCIGTMTPPVGSVLFVGVSVARTTIEKVAPALVPYLLALVVLLLIVTFVPVLSLGLPGLLGLL